MTALLLPDASCYGTDHLMLAHACAHHLNLSYCLLSCYCESDPCTYMLRVSLIQLEFNPSHGLGHLCSLIHWHDRKTNHNKSQLLLPLSTYWFIFNDFSFSPFDRILKVWSCPHGTLINRTVSIFSLSGEWNINENGATHSPWYSEMSV